MKTVTGLCCPTFEMSGYTYTVAKGNNWKGKNEIKFIFTYTNLNTFTYILDKFMLFFNVCNEYKSQELYY